MQPDRPLLTIAIPTYNRERYLAGLLSMVEPQVLNQSRLELIISDNASTDGTDSVARGFAKRTGCRYIRNDANVGADGNILRCFQQAKGKYVWIFGDDDILVPGAVGKVLAHLESGEYDLVYVSSFEFKETPATAPPMECKQPSEISDVNVFVSRINVFFTYISGNIVNKDRVLQQNLGDLTPLVGTSLVQLGWIYTALNGFMKGLYIHERLVGARIHNSGGYKFFQAFGPNLKMVIEQRLKSKNLQRRIMNGTLTRFWPSALINHTAASSSYEKESHPLEILGPACRGNIRYWIFVYPILVSPTFLAKIWLFGVRIFNKLDRTLGFPLTR
jgi:abequosyltransferase